MKQQELDRLWGGVIESWSLSTKDFAMTAQVHVLDNGASSRYELSIVGITELNFKNDGPSEWEQVELTSIEFVERALGSEVVLEFWNGIASARIRGKSVSVAPL